MGLPAGFKPNPYLNNYMGKFFIQQIQLWNHVTARITLIEPYVVKSIGMTGFLGASFFWAVCHDILFFCSASVLILYSIVAWTYKTILKFIRKLILVFRGKKYSQSSSPKDVEYTNYSIQQLFFGMVFFAVLIFLIPTIAMYYYMCFSLIISCVFLVQILLLNLQNLSSNFPSFLILYSLLFPYCLPNSFRLEVFPDKRTLHMIANKCNKASVFHRLVDDSLKIIKEINPLKTIKHIILGDNLFFVMVNLLNIQARIDNSLVN